MTGELPRIDGAGWFAASPVRQVFDALAAGGHEARVIGGAVRNALMERPVTDIDFATTATPDEVATLAAAAGLKTVPTGVEHGTQTVVVEGRGYEVTTLREDIETDGRHAVVRFGRDWTADALRRDFTVNALSVDPSGTVHDPVGGYGDIRARRIRFIGDADRRIAEDRLRVLRFFRFSAEYGVGPLDAEGLAAAIRGRAGLRDLSGERVGNEIRRLIVAPRAAELVAAMQEAGILSIVLAGVGYVAVFARMAAFEQVLGVQPEAAPRLAALACRIGEDVERINARLRLTKAERGRMAAALAATPAFDPPPRPKAARASLYRHGLPAWRDGLRLACARRPLSDEAVWRDLHGLPDRWEIPVFPLSGRDVVGPAMPPGKAVGTLLKAVESWWISQDFAPDTTALRARLQQMMAAAQ